MMLRRLFRSSATRPSSLQIRLTTLLLITAILPLASPVSARAESNEPQENRTVLLPMISAGALANSGQTCALNDEEAFLLDCMRTDPEQVREAMYCNPTLSEVARARAKDMAERDFFDHVNPDGYGPNYLVRQAGFELPGWYPDSPAANNIESIGAHFATAADVWAAWTDAGGHRMHVLGMDPFFAEQVEVGIGYYYNEASHYQAYWVVITAPPEP